MVGSTVSRATGLEPKTSLRTSIMTNSIGMQNNDPTGAGVSGSGSPGEPAEPAAALPAERVGNIAAERVGNIAAERVGNIAAERVGNIAKATASRRSTLWSALSWVRDLAFSVLIAV